MTGPWPLRIRTATVDPLIVDISLTGLVLVLGLVDFVGTVTHTVEGVRFEAADPLGFALLSLWTLPLLARRRAPVAVLVTTTAAFVAFQALGYAPPPIPYGPLVALYTVAAQRDALVAIAATAAVGLTSVIGFLVHHDPLSEDRFISGVVSIVAASMLGYGVQLIRSRATLLEEKAAQLRREQETRTELAIEHVLARISRELHDIVAHHVTVIVAQAGAARRVAHANPGEASHALSTIESTGREALTEMRRLLGVLANDQDGPDRSPPPALAQLPALVTQIERAGLPVDLSVSGAPRPLPSGLELNAYRIVQEALTNSLKHAHGSRATVAVVYQDDALDLDIRDDGRSGVAEAPGGHGVIGMQQRAALLGGVLYAGPGPDGGFLVHARLPLDGEPR